MMHNRYIMTAAVVLIGALALSCEKHEEPVFLSEEIVMDAAPGATKGFLSTSDLAVTGTSFQTYDYLSDYHGTVNGHTGETFEYFSNTLTYKSEATPWAWLFGDPENPTTYHWTRTGVHHFFGWMLADAKSGTAQHNTADRLSPSYNASTRNLHLSANLTVASPQYDFLYSDIVPVDVINDGIPSKVDLPMKHLFGALGMTLSNTSENDIIVSSVSFSNFPGNGVADISYANLSTGVALTHPDPTVGSPFWPNQLPSNVTLVAGENKIYDAYSGSELLQSTETTFRMAWPVTLTALEPEIESTDEDGVPTYTSSSPLINVDCKIGNLPWGTVSIRFPKLDGATWAIEAGKKTVINLKFTDKEIALTYTIIPWDYEEFPMAFEGDAISATQLKFTENTYVDGGKLTDASGKHDVIKLTASSLAGAYVAKGTFKIYTPVNGVLTASLGGDTQYFKVALNHGDDVDGTSNSINIDPQNNGGKITLVIKPNGAARSGSRCTLHFSVRNNGRDADADTEINRDNYLVIIP